MGWYAISDLHYSHPKILEITPRGRTFSSIDEHDEVIIENINRRVNRGDTLKILGDVSFYKHPRTVRQKLICKNIEVCVGNHDRRRQLEEAFGKGRVYDIRVTKFSSKEKVILCHYPILYYPSSHYNAYHLYGHLHSVRENYIDRLFPERRSMDVGVDNYFRLFGEYKPFSEDEILDLLSHRKGHDNVEWYREQEKLWKSNST